MNNRIPMIAGNWKMFKTCSEAVQSARSLVSLAGDAEGVEIMIAPPFTVLTGVFDVIRQSGINLGAQNLHWEKEGAYTGEISAQMIYSAGCRYVIIGHSERRQYFGETDETVNKKIRAAFDAKLSPVICIGENESERESEKTFSILDKQMQKGLEGLTSDQMSSAVIAYEPVWAIGTGKTATPQQVQEVHKYVRNFLETYFDAGAAGKIRIIYGGSVKPDNISELMSLPDIDGALVGGASLDAETFSKIVNYKK
jgi:triosephosphate isomerase (TIM)